MGSPYDSVQKFTEMQAETFLLNAVRNLCNAVSAEHILRTLRALALNGVLNQQAADRMYVELNAAMAQNEAYFRDVNTQLKKAATLGEIAGAAEEDEPQEALPGQALSGQARRGWTRQCPVCGVPISPKARACRSHCRSVRRTSAEMADASYANESAEEASDGIA